ncbi:hypothetical protein [Mucilaginibacter sp. UR6-11]|uniref:hypothetical protein n=1 Tax=Mucilaginibacter sp. UR6-11 TaxID=1435644 RepID=UPI001E3EDBA0|nr:hypothetical protein [Mucilaginibacter sp. UR6-11]MCC8426864.1 hypothetical protein [Mucilaginibacter sp. UR6-11]
MPLSKSNPLILSQKLHAESYIQVKRTFDVKQTTTVIDKIKWDTLKAFGYNDNRSELYIYFNGKLTVNNSPSEVFSLYIPADRVEIVKNAILRLVEIVNAEK